MSKIVITKRMKLGKHCKKNILGTNMGTKKKENNSLEKEITLTTLYKMMMDL